MAKPDKEKQQKLVENMERQIERARTKLQDPDLTEEQQADLQEAIDDFQANIDKVTGGGSTPTSHT